MSRDIQRLPDYLDHISQAIERIHHYTQDMDEMAFLQNSMAQDAVIRNLEILGEASHNIEAHFPEFAAAHPELPLAFAYQMRTALAHGYSGSTWKSSGKQFTWISRTWINTFKKQGKRLS